MLKYNLDIEPGSLWLRTTPTDMALKQPFYCTEAGIFYALKKFSTTRDFKDSFLLFYTLEGAGIIQQGNVKTRLLPGQALFLNCRTPQSYYTDPEPGRWVHYWAHIDGAGVMAFEELINVEDKIVPYDVIRGTFESQFDILLKSMEDSSVETVLVESLAVHQLLDALAKGTVKVYTRNQKIVLETVEYVKQHYSESLEISTLLKMAGMSKSQYMKVFRQYIGTTPYNYMLSLRMTKAKELLEVTDEPIESIAMMVGFPDASAFSTRFTGMVGMSPSKYRKNAITHRQMPVNEE